ncbi:MAG TPA: protein kinase, partial [Polyangiaceae bacterium]|nr:protein kinase [Polyangiaceae bacterium]
PAYMAPEQLTRDEVTQRSDLYSAGLVLWEVCAGRRAYDARNQGALFARVLTASIPKLTDIAPWVPRGLALVIDRALERDPSLRFASAAEMADAITAVVAPAPVSSVAAFVERVAASPLAVRRAVVQKLDLGATPLASPASHRDARGASSGAAAVPAPIAPPAGSGAGHAPPAPGSISQGSRDGALRHETRTVTQPGPPALAAAGPGKTVALFGAGLVVAAALGGGGVWLALRSSLADPTRGGASDRTSGLAATAASDPSSEAASSATARPSASVAGSAEVPAAIESTEPPEPSSSATSGIDKMSPSDVRSQTPHARPGASGAASSNQKPCDPPYYLDANGIRRVKRECF